eukprot:TRINITY_DN9995_c1_g1_i1.p1 TRINITY_DN9995_c1_g1~~TRINITY_DN9995_c1_g1_i1.p1  ORF type:complete len:296 (+),score=29.33 TRINITY_DN9995_c1_g1_i1:28-915(+)
MDRRSKSIGREVFSWAIIIALGITYLLLKNFGSPHISGFFCYDQTIRLPYRDSTVNSLLNGFISYFVPVAITALLFFFSKKRSFEKSWVANNIKMIILFGLITQTVTHILKLAAGRPRPHFETVCNPEYIGNETCLPSSSNNLPLSSIFILNYKCKGNPALFSSEEKQMERVEEARLSFPSGHSSMSWYGMVLSIVILAKVHGDRTLISLAQAACLTWAAFVGISRVNDFKHHTDDVIAGSVLGAFFALLAARYMYAASLLKTAATADHAAAAGGGGNMVGQNMAGNTNDIALVP